MGLRKEHSVLQLFLFNEGFLIESRYRAGYPLYEGFFETRSNGGSSDPPDCPADAICSSESIEGNPLPLRRGEVSAK